MNEEKTDVYQYVVVTPRGGSIRLNLAHMSAMTVTTTTAPSHHELSIFLIGGQVIETLAEDYEVRRIERAFYKFLEGRNSSAQEKR